ncbi:MAG TPA: DinB family protein [Chitinophagaceae bacterium]|nr:DinB family protein [Chitinophagaceae bacterium]
MPRRKTYNYLLLLFLVFSGLAGTPTDDVLSKKERKFAADHMKNTKVELQDAIKGLSAAQLTYKISADKWSVQECVYHIAISEKTLWDMLETSMKAGPTPEKRKDLKVSDEQVVKMIEDRTNKVKTFPPLEPQNTPYKSIEDAMNAFKTTRSAHIKYIKATSEDLRNHFVQMPFGLLDCYQLCLMISSNTNRHMKQINEIKTDPGFPK